MIDDFRASQKPTPSETRAARSHQPSAASSKKAFLTPEQAASLSSAPDDIKTPINLPAADKSLPTAQHSRFHIRLPHSRKGIIGLAVALIVCAGIITFLLLPKTAPKPIVRATPKVVKITPRVAPVTTVASNLTGLPVSPSVNNGPVTGIMIENTTFARPQAGLSQAGVVFEALAEGGVTRFLALFQDSAPANVGPIRSLRPYFLQWAMGFQAGIAHVGGSPLALADIKAWGGRDLDEFFNGNDYHRISSRQAPHNVYTSLALLNHLEAADGYTTSTYTSWQRKAATPAKTPSVASINLALSGYTYNVHYDYDASTNSYNRSEGGAVQTDSNTGAQLSPKVVIAMIIPETNGPLDSTNAYYSNYSTIGSGAVEVFQDGTMTPGQWSKTSNSSNISFTTSSGQPLLLDPGQTWITAVTSASAVTTAP